MKLIMGVLLFVIVLGSCTNKRGSGNIISQTKSVGTFTGINVSGGFQVELKEGTSPDIIVEADDNLIKYIDVNVSGDELKIRLDDVNVDDAHLKITVTTAGLKIKASAGAEVTAKGILKWRDEIHLMASSGASINTGLDAPEVKAEASSGATMRLSGHTKNLDASSSSGASIVAGQLLSENSEVSASSSGSAEVFASISLDASASSGGNIKYRGPVADVKKSESSGGSIEKGN